MSKKLLMRSLLAIGVIFAIGLIGTTNETGGAPAVLSKDNPAVRVVMKAQDRHSAKLMSIKGVVGTATGLTQDGELAIIVYTKSDISRAIPNKLDNVPVRVKVTGEIFALNKPIDGVHDHGNGGGGEDPGPKGKIKGTDRFPRPVPIGVSVSGDPSCIAGTIGVRVTNGPDVFALSNNHVLAEENAGVIGSTFLLQPGLFDTNCDLDVFNNVIGTLFDFQTVVTDGVTPNDMDAAIATTTTLELDNATPANGYGVPSSTIFDPFEALGEPVMKYGRSSNLTRGTVTAINCQVLVIFNAGTALFIDQIVVESKKPFIKLGDSGALLVTAAEANPIGLLFAGDERGKMAFANPIGPILSRFGVTIDGL